MAASKGLRVLVRSFDLEIDHRGDFADTSTLHSLLSLTKQGYIEVWLGGPPSPTVSVGLFEALAGDLLFVGFRDCLLWAERPFGE